MLQFLNLQPEVFAIDINDFSLRIAKIQKRRKRFYLVSFNEVDIPQGIIKEGIIQDKDTLANIITRACGSVKGKKLDTKYVIASLPEEKSFSQVIKLPKMTREELAGAVSFEIENYIPLTVDKVYFDFQEIPSAAKEANHTHVLINVMPKPIVDSYTACLKKAGLIPCVLEVESQANVRSLLKNAKESSNIIFLDLGKDTTTFVIYSGGSIKFSSSLPVSSEQITKAIADNLNISAGEAENAKVKHGLGKDSEIIKAAGPILRELVAQIEKYINFYQERFSSPPTDGLASSSAIEKIVLSGGGANLKKLPDFLSKELKIPVELGNPLENIVPAKKSAQIPQNKLLSFTTVLGLAIRAANHQM